MILSLSKMGNFEQIKLTCIIFYCLKPNCLPDIAILSV